MRSHPPIVQASRARALCSVSGQAYGQTTYLITTLQRVPRGTEGAVSTEGTLAGAVAAAGFAVIAVVLQQVGVISAATFSCIYAHGRQWVCIGNPKRVSEQVSWPEALVVAAAATAANLFESYLGAMLQGRVEWLSNDVINMIQIVLAAALAIAGSHALL